MTNPSDFISADCQQCHGDGYTYDGRFRTTCDCVIRNWRASVGVAEAGPGAFYTPPTVFDPAAGSGGYLTAIIANPPHGLE